MTGPHRLWYLDEVEKKAEYPLSPRHFIILVTRVNNETGMRRSSRSLKAYRPQRSGVLRFPVSSCICRSADSHASIRFYFYSGRYTAISNDLMINGQIRDREVRLIGENGEQLGIMSSAEAYAKAQEAGLDLVKIAPRAKPPVCRIIDYGKYRYEQSRKEREARKKQKIVEIKEVRLSPNIDTNDLNTKIGAAKKFLTKGNKVKVTLRFRGREMAHIANGREIMDQFAKSLEDVAAVEKPPKMEGRNMTMVLGEKRSR